MKKFSIVLLWLSLWALSAYAQTVPIGPDGGGGGGGGGGSYTAASNGGLSLSGTAFSLGDNISSAYANGVLTLGNPGSVVGETCFENATSGTICLAPATGALGTSVATFPVNTGVVAERNLAGSWTGNQDFAAGTLSGSTCSALGFSVGNSNTGLVSVSTTGLAACVNGTSEADYGITNGSSWYFGGSNVYIGTYLFMGTGPSARPVEIVDSAGLGNINQIAGSIYGWTASTTSASGAYDTTMCRQSPGIVEINSGTGCGAFGTVEAAVHALGTAYTVATLPTLTVPGFAYVSDQLTTCAGAGAALTGGGLLKCPVFYNGSSWVGM
jgi:hypothetical protein